MQIKHNLKTFFADLRASAKLQPLIFTAMLFTLGYGAITVIIGSIKLSYFIGMTGSAALIFGIAKLFALKNYAAIQRLDARAVTKENSTAKNIAISASAMSFLHFSIAVVCTFFEEEAPSNYGLWFLVFVAGASVVKILLSAVSSVITKKNHSIILHHIKLIDVANAMISIGLTQRAILYYLKDEAARWASGVGGMIFSVCALLVCLIMFMKYKYAVDSEKNIESVE